MAKKDKKKSKQVEETEKSKKPTKKELFEAQINDLEHRLQKADDRLNELRSNLEQCKTKFEKEKNSKESCVAYLKRNLEKQREIRLEVQDKLANEKSFIEFIEQKIRLKMSVADRSHEARNNVFQHQKMELENKLSNLEVLRRNRNSLEAKLTDLEEALYEKNAAVRKSTRNETVLKIDKLLRDRAQFVKICKNLRDDWEEVFKLMLSVHAKQQLEENVRLREDCKGNAQKLLQAQNVNKSLKEQQKSLELEKEILAFVEENTKVRSNKQENMYKNLLHTNQVLSSKIESKKSSMLQKNQQTLQAYRIPSLKKTAKKLVLPLEKVLAKDFLNADALNETDENDFCEESLSNLHNCDPSKETTNRELYDANEIFFKKMAENEDRNSIIEKYSQKSGAQVQAHVGPTYSLSQGLLDQIKKCRVEYCRYKDACQDLKAIMIDQEKHKKRLQAELEDQLERNGVLVSTILRTGKILENRCSMKEIKIGQEVDCDLLHQIRILLSFGNKDTEINREV